VVLQQHADGGGRLRARLPAVHADKTKPRKVAPGHYRSRKTSELFETMSVGVLELSVPSRDYRHVLVVQDMYSMFICWCRCARKRPKKSHTH
jgi:hypothetical protein